MSQLYRVVCDWSGGKIGTGFTNLFFTAGVSTPQLCADAARKFFADALSLGAYLPTGVNINFRSSVDVLEASNGELTQPVAVTAPLPIAGADPGRYAAIAGACVTWRTGDWVNGHRVRGRTFLVPLGQTGLQTDGTLDTTLLSITNAAAATLIAAAPEFVVWRRPTSHEAADGSAHIVGTGVCSDKTAYLSSRR